MKRGKVFIFLLVLVIMVFCSTIVMVSCAVPDNYVSSGNSPSTLVHADVEYYEVREYNVVCFYNRFGLDCLSYAELGR